MPHIFQNPPTSLRPQFRIHQKPPRPLIMLNPPLTDFLPRHRELTATRCAHDFGHFGAGKELHEAVGKLDSRRVAFVFWSVTQVAGWFEFDGAADRPGTTEVDVACFADVVELEVIDGDDGVWKRLDGTL